MSNMNISINSKNFSFSLYGDWIRDNENNKLYRESNLVHGRPHVEEGDSIRSLTRDEWGEYKVVRKEVNKARKAYIKLHTSGIHCGNTAGNYRYDSEGKRVAI